MYREERKAMTETHQNPQSFNSSFASNRNNVNGNGIHPGFFQRTNGQNINSQSSPTIAKVPPDIITGYSFQFTLKTSDKEDAKHIAFRGSVTDDGLCEIWRRVIGKDRKDIKMSPSWLYKQTKFISIGILVKLFRFVKNDILNFTKKKLLSMCYQKLGMTKANKKLNEKQLMMFTDEEIKIILSKVQKIANAMDLETQLFNYFASVEIYVQHEDFMDILDDLMSYKLFQESVMTVYDELVKILVTTKTDIKFEKKWADFYKNRMTRGPMQRLIFLLKQLQKNQFRTYNVNIKHLTSIFCCTIKEIFLKHLTDIVYSLLKSDMEEKMQQKIDNSIPDSQVGSFSGASLCSCFRISYSRALGDAKRSIYVKLQKNLLCKDNEKHLIPMELQFQNMGGMYLITPSLYPLFKRILSDFSKCINKHFLFPSNSLPNVSKLIDSYINNQQNIEEFKGFYSNNDLSKYNQEISTLMARLIKFSCGKFYWSILKQQEWCEVGMGLRDQFNFGHTQFTNKKKNQN